MAFRNLGVTPAAAIRGHGNLAEFAPLMLIMMLIAEMDGASQRCFIVMAVSFIGRLAHGVCFGFMRRSMLLRIGGTPDADADRDGSLFVADVALIRLCV